MAANEATMGMADAYIAGILNEADTARFKLFAAYKLALSKIGQQSGFPATISWPEIPGY
nr:phage tail assembly chaperone [Pseudomonas sp. GL-RE-26]